MSPDRTALKQECLNALGEVAMEHPMGHQGRLAARYFVPRADHGVIELMFEKGPRTPANLWVCQRFVEPLLGSDIPHRTLPASSLFASKDDRSAPRYGRHSALRPMSQMAHADLVCFAVRSIEDLERIVGVLNRHNKASPA